MPAPMPPLFSRPCEVRFQDVDAAGILFFARVFEYFHDAYDAHLAAHGVRLHEVISARVWGAPLVHVEADYSRPMRYGGSYTLEITSADVGTTSVTVHYAIRSGADSIHCRGLTKHVFIDLASGRPRPVPDDVRAAMTPPA